MSLSLIFELSIWITSVCGVLVALWLTWRAGKQRDLSALAGFAVMMALWCFGHLALFHGFQSLGMVLLLANPLMPTFFLHFALLFVNEGRACRPWLTAMTRHIPWIYVTSVGVILYSIGVNAGATIRLMDDRPFFVFTESGALNLGYTVLIGVLAHAVLLLGWRHHSGNKRRSILAMFGVGAWGLLLATSFVFPSFGIDVFPYPMLLLPSYLLLLVYGVVRYQILAVNRFANRALLALVMMLLVLCVIAVLGVFSGRVGLEALTNVPIWQLWLYSLVVLLMAALVYPTVRRLTERLVFPGAVLNEQVLETWSRQLNLADSWTQLVSDGEALLRRQLGQTVNIKLPNDPAPSGLHLCIEQGDIGWSAHVEKTDDLSPGMRLNLEVFGSLFASSCAALERSLALADAERKRLDEQHLVELGSLSASMAHELRNPLNIISMAAYNAPEETRKHIKDQLARADRLVGDMLVYSGKLSLQYQRVPIKSLISSVLTTLSTEQVSIDIQVEDTLQIDADSHRLQQVFINLIDNGLAYVRNLERGAMCVEAYLDSGRFVCRIHNNGPQLDDVLTLDELFRPFVSKRSGGNGLGLAIVKRIVDAHGGTIMHRNDCGWPVTFEVTLPPNNTEGEV